MTTESQSVSEQVFDDVFFQCCRTQILILLESYASYSCSQIKTELLDTMTGVNKDNVVAIAKKQIGKLVADGWIVFDVNSLTYSLTDVYFESEDSLRNAEDKRELWNLSGEAR